MRGTVTAGTFHAVALAQLRRRAEENNKAVPGLLDRKARILGPLVGGARGPELALAITEIAAEIEWAKANLLKPEDYPLAAERAGRDPSRALPSIAEIFQRYEREKRKRGLVDFDDLIARCAQLLHEDPEFAKVQQWRFRHLFVDEFQDVTPAQLHLVKGWFSRDDLCVVGDPDQAIYGFAGADPAALTDFAREFPEATTVRLGLNYRSTPEIVAAARAVLPRRDRADVRAAGAEGPPPTIASYPSDAAEARGVAATLQREHGPDRPWGEMAVLYRVNAQSAAFEEAFTKAGIPFNVRGNAAFLDRPEVKKVLADVSRSAKAAPGRTLAEHLKDVIEDAAEQPEELREHVEAVAHLGREYLAAEGGPGSLPGFLAYLNASLRGGDDGGLQTDAVDLLTFHRAKGLEWDLVCVTGLEQGLVPISHAKGDPAALDEERRLLYVALSRAHRQLELSWAQERARGMRTSTRRESPYLREVSAALGGAPLPTEAEERGTKANAAAARKRLAAIDLGEMGVEDRALFDELVDWRLATARAASVPAYVVFPDKVLTAVARTRPQSPESLLALPGIGPAKLERYGGALLELVGRHAG